VALSSESLQDSKKEKRERAADFPAAPVAGAVAPNAAEGFDDKEREDMTVRFIMTPPTPVIQADTPGWAALWHLQATPGAVLWVREAGGDWVGVVRHSTDALRRASTVRAACEPPAVVPQVAPDASLEAVADVLARWPAWPCVAVVDGSQLVGMVLRSVLDALPSAAPDPAFALDRLWQKLPDSLLTGVMVVDAAGVLRYINAGGAALLGVEPEAVLNRPYPVVAARFFRHITDYWERAVVPQMLAGRDVPTGQREHRTADGRQLLFQFAALRSASRLDGILITFMDVTPIREAERRAEAAAAEAELAFALTLPNSKVEHKLKTSPEYQDRYDPATGTAVVTAVIPDGTYRHVVNGLRILADLRRAGVLEHLGLDKDTLVRAYVFHDIGKEQPQLNVGDTFVPSETFEPSPLHAARSADWAAKSYGVGPDVEALIRYHHTPEAELPASFPPALRPMLRVLKLVDGLSAGLTRRGARIGPVEWAAGRIQVTEQNPDPRYNRTWQIRLYGGPDPFAS
jgi:PAS domain-containing protein